MESIEELIDRNSFFFTVLFIICTFCGIFFGFLASYFNILYIWMHKVDKKSKRHGGEIVAKVLKRHGVKYIFTLVGGHISPILVGAEKIGIKVIDTRHEATAVFAADAMARMTQSVGVAAVTAGPGLTNTITAAKNAQMAESPVIIIGGASAGLLKGRGALQDTDQMSLFSTICKYCATVTCVRDITPIMRRAFQEAQSGVPGPVFLEFPVDVLYPYALVQKEVVGQNAKSKLVRWYLNNYVENIFAGAWEQHDELSPLTLNIPLPQDSDILKCAELISTAQKPLILVGSQATLPPVPIGSVRTALEGIGIPCYLGGMARGLLGKNSPLQLRHNRSAALRNADVIILAGAVCDFRLAYGRSLPRSAKIIAVNRSREQLFKNSDMFWKPTVAIQGDVGTFLRELSIVLMEYKCNQQWLSQLRDADEQKEAANTRLSEEPCGQFLNPLRVLKEVEKKLPDDAILVVDGGDFVGTASYILRPRGPLQWLDPGPFGTLGVGGGFALAAKLCNPSSEVWIIYGDGSSAYSLAEIDTFTRHKLPVLMLIGNDAGWTQIAREQVPMFGSNVACQLAHSNYHDVCLGYGGLGVMVSHSSELRKVVEEAQLLYLDGNSVLINALIGSSDFRQGSIAV